jgi:hypothetical protein
MSKRIPIVISKYNCFHSLLWCFIMIFSDTINPRSVRQKLVQVNLVHWLHFTPSSDFSWHCFTVSVTRTKSILVHEKTQITSLDQFHNSIWIKSFHIVLPSTWLKLDDLGRSPLILTAFKIDFQRQPNKKRYDPATLMCLNRASGPKQVNEICCAMLSVLRLGFQMAISDIAWDWRLPIRFSESLLESRIHQSIHWWISCVQRLNEELSQNSVRVIAWWAERGTHSLTEKSF